MVTEGDGDTHCRQQLDRVSSEQSTPEVWQQTEQILDIVSRIWQGRCVHRGSVITCYGDSDHASDNVGNALRQTLLQFVVTDRT